MRQLDSMVATLRRARALDSLTPINGVRLADELYATGDDSSAYRELTSVLRRDPTNELVLASLGPVLARRGDCRGGLAALPPPPDAGVGSMQFYVRTWGLCHQDARLRAFLQDGDRRARSGAPTRPVVLGMAAAYLGDREAMYRWLGYAVDQGDWMLFYINIYPEFVPFLKEPRFRALLQRLRMPTG